MIEKLDNCYVVYKPGIKRWFTINKAYALNNISDPCCRELVFVSLVLVNDTTLPLNAYIYLHVGACKPYMRTENVGNS